MKAENGRIWIVQWLDSALLMQGGCSIASQGTKIQGPQAMYHGQKIYKHQGWQGGRLMKLCVFLPDPSLLPPLSNELSIRETSFYQPRKTGRLRNKKSAQPQSQRPHITMSDSCEIILKQSSHWTAWLLYTVGLAHRSWVCAKIFWVHSSTLPLMWTDN